LFVERKTCLKLTWPGRFLLALILILLLFGGIRTLYPFLAATAPVEAEILIVEGWLRDDDLKVALDEFRRGNYRVLITSGGSIRSGKHLYGLGSYAESAASVLGNMGADETKVHAVSAPDARKDRTYQAALAVGRWLKKNHREAAINVFTTGAHARRTQLIYDIALRGRHEVGVIANHSLDFDPERWWRSSAGVRSIIGELIAFVYARFFFFPPEA